MICQACQEKGETITIVIYFIDAIIWRSSIHYNTTLNNKKSQSPNNSGIFLSPCGDFDGGEGALPPICTMPFKIPWQRGFEGWNFFKNCWFCRCLACKTIIPQIFWLSISKNNITFMSMRPVARKWLTLRTAWAATCHTSLNQNVPKCYMAHSISCVSFCGLILTISNV